MAVEAQVKSKTTHQNLNIEATSNRLLGFTQTLTHVRGTRTVSTANTNVAYAVDAAGNLTSDGLRTFEYDAANRLSKARVLKDGEEASIRYLHNATGQRVFKGEPTASQTLPSEATLGQGFIDWLKSNFRWMFTQAQANTSIGTAYVYGDGEIPSWALLGEYDNGSAKGAGRSEFIWLPTEDSGAIPIGMFRNGKLFAIHSDHLGTPRLMTNELNQPVWQWPYSAFGNNKPTGILKATPNPRAAITNIPVLLKATAATVMGLRMPGQLDDPETGTFQNIWRSYWAAHGRYTQNDPFGLDGGWNRFGYVGGNPLNLTDPMGLQATILGPGGIPVPVLVPGPNTGSSASDIARQLDRLFCSPEPDCWDLQQKMEQVAGELRQRHVSMTADVGNLYCTLPIGRFSWLGHQMKFNDKQRQLQKLIEQAQAKGCSVNGEYIKLASMDAPNCPSR